MFLLVLLIIFCLPFCICSTKPFLFLSPCPISVLLWHFSARQWTYKADSGFVVNRQCCLFLRFMRVQQKICSTSASLLFSQCTLFGSIRISLRSGFPSDFISYLLLLEVFSFTSVTISWENSMLLLLFSSPFFCMCHLICALYFLQARCFDNPQTLCAFRC